VLGNSRTPEDPAGFRLEVVLMARLGLEKKDHVLLAVMRDATSFIRHAQAMRPWCDPDVLHPPLPRERLRINPKEMDCAWQQDAGIGLRRTGLGGQRRAAEESPHTTQQYQEPEASSAHRVCSMGMVHRLHCCSKASMPYERTCVP